MRLAIEWEILEYLYKIQSSFLDYFFYFVSELGSTIITLLVVTIVYWCINKKTARVIAITAFFSIVANNLIKMFFTEPRPFQYEGKEYLRKLADSKLSDHSTGTSFPSGHSQNAGSVFTQLIMIFKKKAIIIPSVIMLILVPISRLYLGVHFPVDVIFGLLIGIIIAVVGTYFLTKYAKYEDQIMLTILIIVLPLLFYTHAGKDLFKGYGLLLGFFVGNFIEKKYINFEISNIKKVNIIRYFFGLISVGIVYFALSQLTHISFIYDNVLLRNIFYVITHALVVVFALNVVTLAFKKLKFLN